MNPTLILIFILIVSILYVLVQRHKKEERERLEKSKEVIQNMIDKIPKKMKKIMKKSNDKFPSGPIQLASKIADSQPGGIKEDKLIEAFEDIKDIRYGKIGASNMKDGDTINKWIKVASFTISGAWDPRGFTLEVYPRIRYHTSGRQTLVCLVRNAAADIEAPYVSLTTHNESEANTRLIKDVRVIRTGGSGISGNTIEVWIQFGQSWADTAYVMYYLYNFKTKDFVATVPQAQQNAVPAGQAWGINDQVDPRFIETNAPWVEKIVKNNGSNAYTLQGLWNNAGVRAHLFLNSNDRQADGGPNTATLRNDNGDLRLQSAGGNNIHLKPSGNVGIGTSNPSTKLEVNGTISAMGGANLEGKVRFRHAGANGDDSTDVYNLEKVNTSYNNNSLRMTINDDADESFQIWGNSCGEVGGCGGPGAMKHYFGANGSAVHTGNIQTNGQINTMGRTNYPPGWGGGVRTYDVYASATVAVGDESGNVKGWINGSGDAYFSRNTIVNKLKLGNKWTMSGVGDAHGNDDWLRLFGNNEGGYYGGFAAGRLWTGQGYLAGSDRKMKENIKKVDKKDMLDKVSKLNGYLYNLKEDKDKKKKYGVIAQEIATEFPEMVEKGPNGLLAVDYNQLIGVLLESIKELNEKCSRKKK